MAIVVTAGLCPVVTANHLWEPELHIYCLDILEKIWELAFHSLIRVERKESMFCFLGSLYY